MSVHARVGRDHPRMIRPLLALLLFSVACVYGQDSQEARAILEKVTQPGQSGKSYRAAFSGTAETKGSGLQQKVEITGTITFAHPDKLRAEIKMGPVEALMVRDGAQSWIYRPATKQYMKFSSTASPMTIPGNLDFSLLFGNVSTDLQSAALSDDEEILFDSAPIRCYVILTEANQGVRDLQSNAALIRSTLWIGQMNYLVLRRRVTVTVPSPKLQAPVETTLDIALTKLTWSPPLTGAEFTFTPPLGATEIAGPTPAGFESGREARASREPRRDSSSPAHLLAQGMSNRATVVTDSLPMYLEMSVISQVVDVLHHDDQVTIDFSTDGANGGWCAVTQSVAGGKSGNVLCDSLKLEPAARQNTPSPVPAPVDLTLPTVRASHIPPNPSNVSVYFVPIGVLANVDIEYLVRYYKQRFGLTIKRLPAIALDPDTFNPDRQQNEVEGLIKSVKRGYPTLANDHRSILIGITEADVYITSENWQFALGQRDEGRFAVVSSARMDLNYFDYGAPRDTGALHSRLTKMISREIGFLYYRLPFSDDPRSVVRSSIMGVDELDELGEDY